MAVGDAYVFPGFLTPVLTQLFFPKPPTTFLTCFCRGERQKYAGKKSRLNRGSNSQPPGHESDTLTTEQPGRGFTPLNYVFKKKKTCNFKTILRNKSQIFEDSILMKQKIISEKFRRNFQALWPYNSLCYNRMYIIYSSSALKTSNR